MIIYIIEIPQNIILTENFLNITLIIIEFYILFLIVFIRFNPLLISIFLIIFTILIAINISFLLRIRFYSFILFIRIIGGLIIIFIYFARLNNFEKSFLYSEIFIYFLPLLLLIIIYICFNFNYDYTLRIDYFHIENFNTNRILNLEDLIYCYPESKFLILIISFLFLRLLCIVKICRIKRSPLRKFKIKK